MSRILVINAGSSSLKFAVFDQGLAPVLEGAATEIHAPGGRLRIGPEARTLEQAGHGAALAHILAALGPLEHLAAAGHRVVHGGARLTAPMLATPEVEAEIEACAPLAPLHNPPQLAAIRALKALAPGLPQAAVFDTAFHATNPPVALRYGLPEAEHARGIRRYGFHGISYASLVEALPEISGAPLPARLLACHLGNGASLCAIYEGRSVATTMGYSPLEGLTMGTRAGSIDAAAVLRLARERGLDGAERLLTHESGLLGMGGRSDMRALKAEGTPQARFAVEHFIYWAVRHAGSMLAAMGGLDAVAFTGGIGENDAEIRAGIMAGLSWAGLAPDEAANRARAPRLHAEGSRVAAYIVPAREEQAIARAALEAIGVSSSNQVPSFP